MENTKVDRRIQKTERALLNGLTSLMKTKSINDITVRELADIVDINRSTFYLHYQDIYDMIETIENNLTRQFKEKMGPPRTLNIGNQFNSKEFKEIIENIFTFVLENKEICQALMGKNGDIRFVKNISEIISDRIEFILKRIAGDKYSDYDLELVKNFYVSGCIGLAQHWLNSDEETFDAKSPEHIANIFLSLIQTNIVNL